MRAALRSRLERLELVVEPKKPKTFRSGYLVPATDVHDRLDEIEIPGVTESAIPKKAPGSERHLVALQKKMRR